MSITIFEPTFWSARLRRHLDVNLVYAQPGVVNRNWEGEISQAGDTVHINRVSDPTIHDYTIGTDIQAPEAPSGDQLDLVIDQQKYFNVRIDDVDAAQVNVDVLDQFGQRAAIQMAVAIDAVVSATMVAGATSNAVGTDAVPAVVKADGSGDFTPYQFMVELRRQLNAQNAPKGVPRWAVITDDLEAEFLQDPLYIETAERSETRTGEIGRIAGFTTMTTTAVPASAGSGGTPVANHKVLAGADDYSTTYADQIVKTEAYRLEKQFSDGVKGLQVFGVKVVEPQSLVLGHIADPA